jgi:alanine dehydrogenase
VTTEKRTCVRVIPGAIVRQVIRLEEVIELIEEAFAEDASGQHMNFPVVREILPYPTAGIYGIKAGLAKERRLLGLKAGGYWAQNGQKGIPRHQSTVVLFDPDTGQPVALVGANEITGLRTGAAGAVAAKYLARPESGVAGLIGCGAQGRMQLLALSKLFKLESIRVWDKFPEAARGLLDWAKEEIAVPVEVRSDARQVVEGADIVITATPGSGPVLKASWLRPGQHVNAIGSDTVGKQELEPEALIGSKLVVDNLEQCRKLGETQHLTYDHGPLEELVHAELGDVVSGKASGREAADEVTVYDATEVTFQDLVVAGAIWQRCLEQNLGADVAL